MSDNNNFLFDIKVGDIDLYGHMSHVAYFYYLEEASVKFFRLHSISLMPSGLTPVVASVDCKYIRSINYPNTILIDTIATKISPKKLQLTCKIQSADSTITYAISNKTFVWFDFKSQAAIDLPDMVLNQLGLA